MVPEPEDEVEEDRGPSPKFSVFCGGRNDLGGPWLFPMNLLVLQHRKMSISLSVTNQYWTHICQTNIRLTDDNTPYLRNKK